MPPRRGSGLCAPEPGVLPNGHTDNSHCIFCRDVLGGINDMEDTDMSLFYEEDKTEGYAEWCAGSMGCRVVYPAPNQIQLDMDTEAQFTEYNKRFADLFGWAEMEFPTDIMITPSKSGMPHRHITLTFSRDFTDTERIALQMLLGSDLVREKMNVLRLFKGIKQPCRLFELKEMV